MQIKYSEMVIPYTGKELRSHFIFHRFDIQGNALVAFTGSAQVELSHMVDQADVKAKAPISSAMMLHFLGEFFGEDLEKTILRQRLLMCLMLEHLKEIRPETSWARMGDDLFVGSKKLSVSIATASPVSTLIHAGLNITTQGTPIPTYSLEQAKIEPRSFAAEILKRFKKETDEIALARTKVRGVS